jgi:hypothetical protein
MKQKQNRNDGEMKEQAPGKNVEKGQDQLTVKKEPTTADDTWWMHPVCTPTSVMKASRCSSHWPS